MVGLTSTGGVISLLAEKEDELKIYALNQLNEVVDQFWAEISDSIIPIEVLYEDEQFPERRLAALVASKVYYHLGEFDTSVKYALGADILFDISSKSQYVETIIAKCIDQYIEIKTAADASTDGHKVDPRLQNIVERMFARCFEDGEYKQAIGIAIESRRLDVVEQAIKKGNSVELLQYVLDTTLTLVQSLEYRIRILSVLVKLFKGLPEPNFIAISQCYLHLTDAIGTSTLLEELVEMKDDGHLLVAYQIAFDLEESARQEYLQNVAKGLPPGEWVEETKDTTAMETDDAKESLPAASATSTIYGKIRSILSGNQSIKLQLEFLYRNNHVDLLILKATKDALEPRNSVYHSAVTFANAFMHAGTTSDQFLRSNLEWLSRASNWTKFSATAGLGVIHKGHLAHGKALLEPYLPHGGVAGSPYSEGGSLYALGLIHANHGQEVLEYLRKELKSTESEIVQHGACLGLGVAAMATDNSEIYQGLTDVLYSDSAVAGEAAGLAMGLVLLGTGSQKGIEEMLQYAHETQHEKIIRGLAIGISLILYGREEEADSTIELLCSDKDAILRYGGIFGVAMAYAGTGNNKAIRRLLHVAVSDVNDDVRRAAVTALGFLLFRTPKQVPRIVQLLSESYNAHVRYGATLALGISCAGTGLMEAVDILEPMTKDPVDYVRQGALVSLAMVLVQHTEATNKKTGDIRKLFAKVISDKHEDVMAKFGAVLAQGIIDAGGRNVTISLQSSTGHVNMSAVVGMAIFTQFWYWFPLSHCLSLAFTPTAIIGLNKDLELPKFDFKCNARPSLFAYPVETKPATAAVVEKVAAAVLSTTAKANARAKKSEKEKTDANAMDLDEKKDVDTPTAESKAEADKDEPMTEDTEKPKKKKEESSHTIQNLTRVVPAQLKYVTFEDNARYVPVKTGNVGGILLMRDRKPTESTKLIEISAGAEPASATTPTAASVAEGQQPAEATVATSGTADFQFEN